jgi:hypothetical protein
MASKDLYNNILGVNALNTTTVTTDTTTTGNEIDMQGYESITFYMIMGTQTDGDFALQLTESDTSGGSFTAVADADLLGSEPAYTADTSDNQVGQVGYIGNSRYLKATVVSTNTATSGGTFTVLATQGNASDSPVV